MAYVSSWLRFGHRRGETKGQGGPIDEFDDRLDLLQPGSHQELVMFRQTASTACRNEASGCSGAGFTSIR